MKSALLVLIMSLISVLCIAVGVDSQFDYDTAWTEIENLEQNQMYKSEIEKLELVYQAAEKDKRMDYQIKVLIYQMAGQSWIEDTTDQKVFDLVQSKIRQASFPASAILHSILAEMYWDYYQNNYYVASQRTETVNFKQAEIDTWDLKTVAKAAFSEFKLSLQYPSELQKYSFDAYPELIRKGSEFGWNLRPTVFDLLAHRALQRYVPENNGISVLFDNYEFTNPSLLSPAGEFASMNIAPVDTLSGRYLALKLYQDIIRFHLNDKDPEPLVVADLERLGFVKQNAGFTGSEAAYDLALINGETRYSGQPASTQYTFTRAALIQKGNSYKHPVTGDELQGQNNVIALELCNQAMAAFPESYGGQSCKALASVILKPEIDLTMENVVLPDKPIKLIVKTRNVSKLFLKVFKLPYLDKDNEYLNLKYLHNWQYDERLVKFLSGKPVYTTEYVIPDEGDYTAHTIENALATLPSGKYLLLASDDFSKEPDSINLKAIIFISSNLVLVSPIGTRPTLQVCNRETGKPVHQAKVDIFKYKVSLFNPDGHYKSIFKGKTNQDGIIALPKNGDYYESFFIISQDKDSLWVENKFYYYQYERAKPQKLKRIMLLTDRSIYRPGQTIYCKGIAYETDNEKYHKLLPKTKLKIVLYDVNHKEISTHNLKTNEFGSINCSFTAPRGVLTGQMRISAFLGKRELESAYVNVEEYKRPKFEVTLEMPKDTYRLGQSVTVTGKALAYAGFPVDGATVTYTIKRSLRYAYQYWWWSYPTRSDEQIVSQGSCDTGKHGGFNITFLAEANKFQDTLEGYYYNFEINANVTDINGETRSGILQLNIGEKDLILDPVIAKYVRQATRPLAIPLNTTNLNGEKVSAKGKLTISRLETPNYIQKRRNPDLNLYCESAQTLPDRNLLNRSDFRKLFPNDPYGNEDQMDTWKAETQVYSGNFNTGIEDTLRIAGYRRWKAGMYRIEAVSTYNGNEVKTVRYFTLYTPKSGNLPYTTPDLFIPVKTTCEPGQTAEILVGTSYSDVAVRFEVERNHRIVDSLIVVLSNQQRLFRIPVLESDRGSFYIHVKFIRDNRIYIYDQEIAVSWKNKQLDIEYSTFRDKLLPGQKEEWRLKFKDYKGKTVSAEVLASMYDASLDALLPCKWYANLYNRMNMTRGWFDISGAFLINSMGNYSSNLPQYPVMEFSKLNDFGKRIFWNNRYKAGSPLAFEAMDYGDGRVLHVRGGRANEMDISIDGMSDSGLLSSENVMTGGYSVDYGKAQSGVVNIVTKKSEASSGLADSYSRSTDLSGISARSNFAETAFFYPTLRTDAAGDVSIAFTMPESLTKWKFQTLALTKELQIGLGEKSIVTQKPLMVIPNLPRFFREGDRISISSKISAPGDADQSGVCQLYLFNALTLSPVEIEFGLTAAQKSFSIKKGESTVVEWSLNIPYGISAVTSKIVAKAGNFSDGEENTIPVLTNRMLVTESMPLPVRGNKSKTFVFEKLKQSGQSTTLKNHKLTLEYTSNPAWYAVQALPYMMEYPHSCNEQIFTRFYANSLAGHIANSNPKLRKVFDAWKESPNKTALLSNLEKNQELKSVILQETPWVLDAQDEARSKQRIGLLFAMNTMKDKAESTLLLLKKNQSSSGAWPWFNGMDDSWWVTQYIVEGLAHLQHLEVASVLPNEQKAMLNKAVQYLDKQILIDYQDILKYGHKDDDHLGYMEMHYLYTRSFFPEIKMNDKAKEAVDYFRGQTAKYWQTKGLYGQALIALAEYRSGNKTLPRLLLKSIKERSIENEEFGMYWKENSSIWYWYQAPIETQALLIEAFSDITQDTEAVDGQRTWLLKQKQTTNWKTTKATAEACYALLLSGTNWLNSDKLATVTIGGKEINPEKLDGGSPEAGTGYFKTSWSGDEISAKQADVTVVNPNPVPAWGSLYWQYFEDLDKITPAETPLKLKKQLFLERTTDKGTVLDPISDKAQLKVGDKVIVRIELRSDRDMEYVHMKDMRSAGFEPLNVISHYKWQDGLGYYEATGDAATNFFIEYLAKGTYVFKYPLRVSNKGDFSNGVTTIQCMYAPKFTSHSEGIRVEVK